MFDSSFPDFWDVAESLSGVTEKIYDRNNCLQNSYRSSHQRSSVKKGVKRETPVLEFLFNKVSGLQSYNFIKKTHQHRWGFFSIWAFFYEHSRFTGQKGKREAISLCPLYHFHPFHRHLDISRAITAGSSPLHIADSPTRTVNLWFPSASR